MQQLGRSSYLEGRVGTASGIVEATEGLYRAVFAAAVGFGLAAAAWGLAIAPFNGFNHHHARSLIIGLVLTAVSGLLVWRRRQLWTLLQDQPAAVLSVALLGVGVLWADGGWRSSFYLASYSAIALAAVATNVRWSLACAAVLAVGYVGGLAVHGYSWERLQHLHDADSVIANTGGYFLAAYFFAAPVAWLGGYVARINQVMDGRARPKRLKTRHLSPREVQVVQLVADGLSNERIAERLVLSSRTVQSHVAAALRKTEEATRTGLAVLAVREGLVPLDPTRVASGGMEAAANPPNGGPHSGAATLTPADQSQRITAAGPAEGPAP